MPDATVTGATADPADAFQSLYDQGAFSTDGKPPADAENKPAQSPQTETVETEATPPQQEVAAEGEAQEEAPKANWENLDQYLSEHQIDAEQFRAIPVTVKIDGLERQVPLSDVIKSYQLEGHVNNKSVELSNQRRTFEEESRFARQNIQQQWERNEALGKLAVQQLQADFQRVDWNTLRMNNPAEWSALQQDFNNRNAQIQQYLQQVQQSKVQEQERQSQETEQWKNTERQRLAEARPEWRDQAVYTKDRDQIISYAKSQGFTDAELSQVFDHRYMTILHDAARYQALQAAKPATTKLVREAPKMAKPGTRQNRDPSQVARQNALERLNRNPRDQDAQAAYFETLQ